MNELWTSSVASIRAGKLEDFKLFAGELVSTIRETDPRPVSTRVVELSRRIGATQEADTGAPTREPTETRADKPDEASPRGRSSGIAVGPKRDNR
jgi:hypothetical protein